MNFEKTAYCVRCKEVRPIINARIEEMAKNKMPVLKGNCSVCGTKMSKILPKETPSDFPQPIPTREINRKEKVDKFIREANNNEMLKESGVKVIKGNYYDLLKILVIILGLGVLVFGYMAYNDKFLSEMICGNVACGNLSCANIPDCNCNASLICNYEKTICNCNVTLPNMIQINMTRNIS